MNHFFNLSNLSKNKKLFAIIKLIGTTYQESIEDYLLTNWNEIKQKLQKQIPISISQNEKYIFVSKYVVYFNQYKIKCAISKHESMAVRKFCKGQFCKGLNDNLRKELFDQSSK